ncbi:MAG: hypothetical protein KatS3mg060_0649 [Dehalococcoidia bacterium]|nr:MAG: hypothetical protein KatS3mg060_0649 [Dehalococcoidia bacterium]
MLVWNGDDVAGHSCRPPPQACAPSRSSRRRSRSPLAMAGPGFAGTGLAGATSLAAPRRRVASVSVSPSNPFDGWVGGDDGAVYRWDGTAFGSGVPLAASSGTIAGLAAVSSTLAFAVTNEPNAAGLPLGRRRLVPGLHRNGAAERSGERAVGPFTPSAQAGRSSDSTRGGWSALPSPTLNRPVRHPSPLALVRLGGWRQRCHPAAHRRRLVAVAAHGHHPEISTRYSPCRTPTRGLSAMGCAAVSPADRPRLPPPRAASAS